MKPDPIVADVRKKRKEILESFDWDFETMCHDAMKRQWQSGRNVISPSEKKNQPGVSPNAYPLRKDR